MTTKLWKDDTTHDTMCWLKAFGVEPSEEGIKLAMSLIEEEFEELKVAIGANEELEVLDAICDLKVVINNLAFHLNFRATEVDDYQNAVSLSNWSKLAVSREQAIETVDAYGNGTHPDKFGEVIETYFESAVGGYAIKRKGDGKILKSLGYKPANEALSILQDRRKITSQ